MQCSGSIEVASDAQKFNSPLMDLPWTVANDASLDVELPKQLKWMMNGDRIQKKFAK
jgi:hypothetical protein